MRPQCVYDSRFFLGWCGSLIHYLFIPYLFIYWFSSGILLKINWYQMGHTSIRVINYTCCHTISVRWVAKVIDYTPEMSVVRFSVTLFFLSLFFWFFIIRLPFSHLFIPFLLMFIDWLIDCSSINLVIYSLLRVSYLAISWYSLGHKSMYGKLQLQSRYLR